MIHFKDDFFFNVQFEKSALLQYEQLIKAGNRAAQTKRKQVIHIFSSLQR